MVALVWMVTGSTTGIGAALVEHIIARGDKVIATGRNAEKRLHLQSDNVAVLDLDITAEQSAINAQVAKAWNVFGHIDVLLNNAGVSSMSSAEEADDNHTSKIFQANLFGHMHVTRAMIPRFRAQGHGYIGFTASSIVWCPLPFMSDYAASKAALCAYVESLHKELKPLGISCTSFMCGGFPTHLGQPREADVHGFGSEGTTIEAYKPLMGDLVGMFASDPMAYMVGDVAKLAPTIVDVIKGEGVASGKDWPLRLALGSDAYASGMQRCQEQMKLLNDWKTVTWGTDRDGYDHVPREQYSKFSSLFY